MELKTGFTLSLFHQAINRQSMSDQVYIAVPRKTGKAAMVAIRRNKMLCRRLGIGLDDGADFRRARGCALRACAICAAQNQET